MVAFFDAQKLEYDKGENELLKDRLCKSNFKSRTKPAQFELCSFQYAKTSANYDQNILPS